MIVCILGLSASGKDTIVNEITSKYSFIKIIQFTNRPLREHEIDGQDYYFVSNDTFENLNNNQMFISCREFNSKLGKWNYGIKNDFLNINENSIIIIDIEGLLDLNYYYGKENVISIFIDVDYNTRLNRAKRRSKLNIKEFERRYQDDLIKIELIKNNCDHIVSNNNFNDCISEIENILKL